MHIIAISYKQNFEEGKRERKRMERYAAEFDSYTIIIFTLCADGRRDVIRDGKLRICATNSKTRLRMLFDAYRIGRSLLREHPERKFIVTAQDPFEPSVVGLLLGRESNAVLHVQIHGDYFGTPYWRRESLLNRLRYVFGLHILSRVRAIRVVSERIKRSLIKRGVPLERITVLPIRTEMNTFLSAERAEVSDEVTILAAGRLAPEKNLGMLIQAVSNLKKEFPMIRLRILGDGRERSRLEGLVRTYNVSSHVEILAWVQDISSEMGRASIYALTSNHEGYALVLVEAMACGLPIVTTDVGCAGEVLVDDEHGYIIPIEDVWALTDRLRSLITDPEKRKRFGEAGRRTAARMALSSEVEYIKAWVASLSAS